MLDPGYSMLGDEECTSGEFHNIRYPETGIQDQSTRVTAALAADKFDFKIICIYEVS